MSPSSPVRSATPPKRKQCRPTPAGFSMSAPAAGQRCGTSRAIAACSAPTARYPVPPFRRSDQARRVLRPAANGEQFWQMTLSSSPELEETMMPINTPPRTPICAACGCSLVRLGIGKDKVVAHRYNGPEYLFCCQGCVTCLPLTPGGCCRSTNAESIKSRFALRAWGKHRSHPQSSLNTKVMFSVFADVRTASSHSNGTLRAL